MYLKLPRDSSLWNGEEEQPIYKGFEEETKEEKKGDEERKRGKKNNKGKRGEKQRKRKERREREKRKTRKKNKRRKRNANKKTTKSKEEQNHNPRMPCLLTRSSWLGFASREYAQNQLFLSKNNHDLNHEVVS